ncbi:MAG: hypothetical protein WBM90_12325 [Acidimicrobiia bacterium]
MSDPRRKMIGTVMLLAGFVGLVLGVIWIHWSSLPQTEVLNGVDVPVVVDYLNWWPRGIYWKGIGYLIVLGATTLALVGGCFLWVLNKKMTWARATVAAMIAWLALLFYFGMVPSEWLNFAQTDLEWGNDPALVIPPVLVLGNTIEISYSAIKDSISMGYIMVMLGASAVLAVQLQKIKEGRPSSAAAVEKKSPYGRPLVKGAN